MPFPNTEIEIIGGQQGTSAGQSAAAGAAAGSSFGPWGAVVGGALSLAGGLFGNKSSAKEAQKNRDFQERMSNTAHQREVYDLRAAGLNPILSATGGAGSSTPSGAVAPQSDVMTPAVHSGISARRSLAELESMRLANENVKMDTALKKTQGTAQISHDYNLRQQGKLLKQELEIGTSSAARARTEAEIDETTFGRVLRWIDRFSSSVQGSGNSAQSLRRGFMNRKE